MRWFWIDRFTELQSGQYAKSIKNVTLAEEHLHDHFPGFPVMPGSLMLEGMAQTGGILLGEKNNFAKLTAETVIEIRFLDSSMTRQQIANKYRVTTTTVSHIVNRKTWKHV